MNKYNHKALINYYARLVYKEVYKESDIPDEIKTEVLHEVDQLKKLPYKDDDYE